MKEDFVLHGLNEREREKERTIDGSSVSFHVSYFGNVEYPAINHEAKNLMSKAHMVRIAWLRGEGMKREGVLDDIIEVSNQSRNHCTLIGC